MGFQHLGTTADPLRDPEGSYVLTMVRGVLPLLLLVSLGSGCVAGRATNDDQRLAQQSDSHRLVRNLVHPGDRVPEAAKL